MKSVAKISDRKPKPKAGVITCTLGDLLRAEEAFPRVLAKLTGQSAIHVAKIYRAVRDAVADFKEQRERYIRELGAERDATPEEAVQYGPSARIFGVTPDHDPEFQKRIQALKAADVEIACAPIPQDTLAHIAGDDIDLLFPLIAD